MFVPMVQGRRVYTIEGLRQNGALHPAQQAMVERLGSQCGYCTPGVVMAAFEACYREDLREPWQLDDQMCGNLCRCTGYRPIRDAVHMVAGTCPEDSFKDIGPRRGRRTSSSCARARGAATCSRRASRRCGRRSPSGRRRGWCAAGPTWRCW
ncbi:2Fe-2S iron-sulfur cluster-binding protein [Nannocystis pusilla]|uniref:2Fe-2S iron-sulfur cluster-binding protein n=1 Tax=Nannocystis pusilla TaxID=889268 RepID=UPI003B7624E6